MTSQLRRLTSLALLALACRTTTVAVEPTEAGDAATPPGAEPAAEDEPGGTAVSAGELTGPVRDGAELAADPPTGAGADAGPPAGEPAKTPPAKAERPPLPAPLFTKVDPTCGQDPGVGDPATPFALQTPEGKPIALADFRGKVVLLNYWGTWCQPCLQELPEFDRLYRRYRAHGLVLIAVATDAEAAPVQDFARQRKLAAKLAIGGEAHANAYKSPKFPFSFVVDPKGVIRASYRGFKAECLGKLEADLRAELDKLGR